MHSSRNVRFSLIGINLPKILNTYCELTSYDPNSFQVFGRRIGRDGTIREKGELFSRQFLRQLSSAFRQRAATAK